ncbi:MAG TPA: hypothetical protein VIL48_02275 [Acidimicrobiales bacterium]
MPSTGLLDDATIEAIVAGDEVDARFEQLVAFVRDVQALGDGPPPPPSPALEAVLAGRTRPGLWSGRRTGRLGAVTVRVAGLGAVAKIGLGISVAAAGAAVAGAGGVLPGPIADDVRGAIEAVTPVEFGGPGASDEPAGRDDPARFGDRVSADARGGSDGAPGGDGREIFDEAPGAAHRPDHAGPDGHGPDRVAETPAGTRPVAPSGATQTPAATAPGPAGGAPPGVTTTTITVPGTTAPGPTGRDPAVPTTDTIPASSAPTRVEGRVGTGGGGSSAVPGG